MPKWITIQPSFTQRIVQVRSHWYSMHINIFDLFLHERDVECINARWIVRVLFIFKRRTPTEKRANSTRLQAIIFIFKERFFKKKTRDVLKMKRVDKLLTMSTVRVWAKNVFVLFAMLEKVGAFYVIESIQLKFEFNYFHFIKIIMDRTKWIFIRKKSIDVNIIIFLIRTLKIYFFNKKIRNAHRCNQSHK